eukprot:TRINITY_DN49889_c0_g1_i1.p1 TRINITY_DN49889_c0_g1~~TRINITY_DN49889_c0_g1_i1.p1  ORF type:complete len:202 (+),score=43.70 TRINITY_DN49889_c0_g1_i1:43-606(+)
MASLLLQAVTGKKDVSIKLDHLGLGHADLACSACLWTAEHLRLILAKKNLKKKASGQVRQAAASELLSSNAACDEKLYPETIVQWSKDGWTQYVDYREMVGAGEDTGGLEGLMAEGVSPMRDMIAACTQLLKHHQPAIVSKVGTTKGRLGAFNFQRWFCLNETQLCPSNRTKGHAEALSERDDDEDL